MVFSPGCRQIFYSLACEFNIISNGMIGGFLSILMSALRDPQSDIKMDEWSITFIASLPLYSGFITIFSLGPLMQIFGRRTAHFIYVGPILVGWIICAFSYSKISIYIGLLFLGFNFGGVFFMSVCVGELTKPRIRGIMLNLKQLALNSGIAISHGCSNSLHWRHVALIGAIVCLISLIITYLWPESPDWLISKGRYDEAEKTFYYIRGHSKDAEIEVKNMIATDSKLKAKMREAVVHKLKHDITQKAFWRTIAVFVCILLMFECAGRRFFTTFALEINQKITGEAKTGFVFTMIIDIIGILATFVSLYLAAKVSRRNLIIRSGFVGVTLMFLFCLLSFVNVSVYSHDALKWGSLLSLALFFAIAFSTILPTGMMLMGELIPLEYRGIGATFDCFMMSLFSLISVSVFPSMVRTLNVHGTLFIFAIIQTLVLCYLHFELPETKNRTLHGIAEYFRGNAPKIVPVDELQEKQSTLDESRSMI